MRITVEGADRLEEKHPVYNIDRKANITDVHCRKHGVLQCTCLLRCADISDSKNEHL